MIFLNSNKPNHRRYFEYKAYSNSKPSLNSESIFQRTPSPELKAKFNLIKSEKRNIKNTETQVVEMKRNTFLSKLNFVKILLEGDGLFNLQNTRTNQRIPSSLQSNLKFENILMSSFQEIKQNIQPPNRQTELISRTQAQKGKGIYSMKNSPSKEKTEISGTFLKNYSFTPRPLLKREERKNIRLNKEKKEEEREHTNRKLGNLNIMNKILNRL